MPGDEAAATAQAYFDALNDRDLERGASLVADGCEWLHVATGDRFVGPEGFLTSARRWLTAFPDTTIEVKRVLPGEGWVVAEVIARGTHTGPLATPAGTIPPTGRTGDLECCYVLQIRAGQIVGGRIYYDTTTMLERLGLLSQRAMAFGLRVLKVRNSIRRRPRSLGC
jgi:steroid delta-isomerase-like uncharacterized protein